MKIIKWFISLFTNKEKEFKKSVIFNNVNEDIIKEEIPHICKYCGAITIQDDETCYKKPQKEYIKDRDFKIIN